VSSYRFPRLVLWVEMPKNSIPGPELAHKLKGLRNGYRVDVNVPIEALPGLANG